MNHSRGEQEMKTSSLDLMSLFKLLFSSLNYLVFNTVSDADLTY